MDTIVGRCLTSLTTMLVNLYSSMDTIMAIASNITISDPNPIASPVAFFADSSEHVASIARAESFAGRPICTNARSRPPASRGCRPLHFATTRRGCTAYEEATPLQDLQVQSCREGQARAREPLLHGFANRVCHPTHRHRSHPWPGDAHGRRLAGWHQGLLGRAH